MRTKLDKTIIYGLHNKDLIKFINSNSIKKSINGIKEIHFYKTNFEEIKKNKRNQTVGCYIKSNGINKKSFVGIRINGVNKLYLRKRNMPCIICLYDDNNILGSKYNILHEILHHSSNNKKLYDMSEKFKKLSNIPFTCGGTKLYEPK